MQSQKDVQFVIEAYNDAHTICALEKWMSSERQQTHRVRNSKMNSNCVLKSERCLRKTIIVRDNCGNRAATGRAAKRDGSRAPFTSLFPVFQTTLTTPSLKFALEWET